MKQKGIKRQGYKYLELPYEVIQDNSISRLAHEVWAYFRFKDGWKGICPAIDTIAEELNASPYGVQKAIKQLEKQGYLGIDLRQAESGKNSYILLKPKEWIKDQKRGTPTKLVRELEDTNKVGEGTPTKLVGHTNKVGIISNRSNHLNNNIYMSGGSLSDTGENQTHTPDTPDSKPDTSKPKSQVTEFIEFWGQTYQKDIGSPYAPSWAKEGKLVKDLLNKGLSLDQLKQAVGTFFQDSWYRSHADIGVFSKSINKLMSAGAPGSQSTQSQQPQSKGTIEETSLYKIVGVGLNEKRKFIFKKLSEEWTLQEVLDYKPSVGHWFQYNLKKLTTETLRNGVNSLIKAEAILAYKGMDKNSDYEKIIQKLKEYTEELESRQINEPSASSTALSSDWVDYGMYLINHTEQLLRRKGSDTTYPLSAISSPFSEDTAFIELKPYLESPRRLREVEKSKRINTIKNVDYVKTKSLYLSASDIADSCEGLVHYAFMVLPLEDRAKS